MMKSHLGRKRSRAQIAADKAAELEAEEAARRNEIRLQQLEEQLAIQQSRAQQNDQANQFANYMMCEGHIKLNESGEIELVNQAGQAQFEQIKASPKKKE